MKLHEPMTYAAALNKAFVYEAGTNKINSSTQIEPTGGQQEDFREGVYATEEAKSRE